MKYVVNVSGGLTSFEALRRTIERYGKEDTHALFADTQQEDEDLYRFLEDQERYFGIEIERVCDGRTIWHTWKERRCITLRLPNGAQVAPCAMLLKREAIDKVLASRFKPGEYVRVFGYEFLEIDRMERLQEDIAPEKAWFPLAEPPYVDKCHIRHFLDSIGIAVPRLYTLGFAHNNCGGGCVKAGQAHWAHLWRTLPDRYRMWEAQEETIRQHLQKDISILKDRRGGKAKPMTLQAFRARLEAGDTTYDKEEWGGCGCFAPVAQSRMDAMVLMTDVTHAPRTSKPKQPREGKIARSLESGGQSLWE